MDRFDNQINRSRIVAREDQGATNAHYTHLHRLAKYCNRTDRLLFARRAEDFSSVLKIATRPVLQRSVIINVYTHADTCTHIFSFPIAFQGLLLPFSSTCSAAQTGGAFTQKSSRIETIGAGDF